MNPLLAVAEIARRTAASGPAVPKRFTEFVAELGVTLTESQEALCRVAFDGAEPCELPAHLRPHAERIFGPVERFPPLARRVVAAVCGGRAGKTYIMGALRILHLGLTVSLRTLAAGEQGVGILVAHRLDDAKQALRYVKGALLANPDLGAMIQSETELSVTLRRHDSKVIRIECRPATAGGGAQRGQSFFGGFLDECCFFRDNNYAVNDDEVFRAISPRVLPGGQVVLASTPYAESGLLFTEFKDNHPNPSVAFNHAMPAGTPHRAIACHAPTVYLRPDQTDYVNLEYRRDPVNAEREFGAKFMPATSGAYFDPGSIAVAAVGPELPLLATDEPHVLAIGADLGFTSDSAAAVVVERTAERWRVLATLELRPMGEALKPSAVFAAVAELADRYGIREVVSDQYYAESAKEAFWDREPRIGFIQTPSGDVGKGDMFTVARVALNERRLTLPAAEQRLLDQLREVQSRPTPGGRLSITQPRKGKGGHGDLVSALVAAMWHAERLVLPVPDVEGPEPGTQEWGREQARKLKEETARRIRERQGRKWWKG